MTEAYIFDALRTPRGYGKPGGALYEVKAIELLGACLKAVKSRNKLSADEVEDAIIGCCTPVLGQGHNIAKAALLYAGWPVNTGGLQINRYGASGLDAVNLAAMKINSGWNQLLLAGGVESMSRTPMRSDGGALLFDPEVINKVHYLPPGIAADLIATLEKFTRQELDTYSLQSQTKATHAWENGYFHKSIVPIFDRNGLLVLGKDETIDQQMDAEERTNLPASFKTVGQKGFDEMALSRFPQVEKISHLHTEGNSAKLADGASLVLVGSLEKGRALGLKPRAKILSASNASVDPTIMLTGAGKAAQDALAKIGMQSSDIDLWEINESFAASLLKFQKDFGLDESILNVNGGAIALGHPLGATGAMLVGCLLDEMERKNIETGLAAISGGAGSGVATIIERVG